MAVVFWVLWVIRDNSYSGHSELQQQFPFYVLQESSIPPPPLPFLSRGSSGQVLERGAVDSEAFVL